MVARQAGARLQASADSDERAIRPSDNSSLTGTERSINQHQSGGPHFQVRKAPLLPHLLRILSPPGLKLTRRAAHNPGL